jgi:hypothetical protein
MGQRALVAAAVHGLLHKQHKKIYFLSKMTYPIFMEHNREIVEEIEKVLKEDPYKVNFHDIDNGKGVTDGVKSYLKAEGVYWEYKMGR